MLLLASVAKAISEILALALLGQAVLRLIAGKSRENNFVYLRFASVTRPVMWVARKSMPRIVLARHIGIVVVPIVFVL